MYVYVYVYVYLLIRIIFLTQARKIQLKLEKSDTIHKLNNRNTNLVSKTILLYFRSKYDYFGLANINWTRTIRLKFVLNMGFSNFEGKYQKSRDFGEVQVVLYYMYTYIIHIYAYICILTCIHTYEHIHT